MKPMRLMLAVVFVTIFSTAAIHTDHSPLTEFYESQKNQENVMAMKLPGWLVNTVSFTAGIFTADPELKSAFKFGRKLKSLRMLHIEIGSEGWEELENELYPIINNSEYEELVEVRDNSELVRLMIRQSDTRRHELLLLVEETNEMMILDMDTRMKDRDFKELMNHILEIHAPSVTKGGDQ